MVIIKTKDPIYLRELQRIFDQVHHNWLVTSRGVSGIYKHHRSYVVGVKSFFFVYVQAHSEGAWINIKV
jgi:hypothetical protein